MRNYYYYYYYYYYIGYINMFTNIKLLHRQYTIPFNIFKRKTRCI